MTKTAFILVDYQNDFVDPRGALYVRDAEKLVNNIQNFLLFCKDKNILTVATQDWHPETHCSFASSHGKEAFTMHDGDMLRPDHCVADTMGAQLYPPFQKSDFDVIIHKATEQYTDAYSGFSGTRLAYVLQERGIEHVYVAGVATDYCVKATAFDALKEGFSVTILTDLIAAVDAQQGIFVLDSMQEEGMNLVATTEIV